MRICTIHSCRYTGDRRCCIDCDKNCPDRCLNHPDRCKCCADEEPREKGYHKSWVNTADVLRLAEQGLLYKDIARILHCSETTVTNHMNKAGYRRYKRGGPDG